MSAWRPRPPKRPNWPRTNLRTGVAMALAATPARALAQARQERMPATVLELDLDTCTNTYGVAPCVAGRKDSGTAQAGGASTITLRAAASAGDDSYKGMTVRLTGGTGALQERKILSYVGATKIATLTTAWGTPPDATSTYDVIDRANGCYNVFAGQSPCQSQANYAKGVKTVKFCSRGMPLPAGEQIRPYIATATFTPTEIDTTKGLAARSQTTVSLADEPCRDDLDLYAADRATPAAGTYWTRLIARNPNAIGRFARMRKGYVVSPWDWGTFQTELYIVEGIAGPDDNGRVDVALSDAVKLLDRVKIPAATDGKLTADVPATFNTGIVASATSTSVVLATSASAVDSAYNGQEILITGGLGLNQRRVISAYVGLSRTATVAAWTTVPDATSLYEVAPLSLNVGAGKGAQYNDPAVTLRNEYVRVGDEVIRYGAKAGDVLSWPDGSYRAQFSTTRADHKANDGAQQCLARIAATASSWVRDMLNVSLADGYLDLVQLAQEEADWFGTKALITACIGESETGSALLTDLLKDLNMMVWWHPVEQKVKFKVNMPAIGDAAGSLTDDNFIFGQVAAEKLDMERLTRSEIDFDLVSATIDRKKRTNYRTVQIFIDTAAESPNGYGDVRADTRQSRWLTAPNAVFAAGVVERRLLAVRDAPWKLTASLDPRDEVALGSLRDVTTRKIVDAAGNPLTLRHRVMKVTDQGAQIDIEMRSTTFGKRYAFICPNGYPDYPSASFNQRQRAFIAGDTDVMSDGSSAYLII